MLSLYPDFSCIADRCPATCCSGWKITVDQESYQRFIQLSDDKLRQDILANLVEQDESFHFANRQNGDCAMLDADGLCRIQRKTREEMLCHTCRKFPRITAEISEYGIVCLSLAASCPVVAEYILDGAAWLWLDESGQFHPLSPSQWERLQKITAMPVLGNWTETVWNPSNLLDHYVDLALDVLEVLLHFPEIPYLEHSFDLYELENPDLDRFAAFFFETEKEWRAFVEHYIIYRYPSRYLEFQQEDSRERGRQVQGELLLMRIILCSRYVLRGTCTRSDYQEILHWVYRFSAHGQLMAEQVHGLFISWEEECFQTIYQNVCLR
ncbi:MAG: flagellin lysine-N-methylase [Lachnospiraceae bacterium]|nr:flagellin lysine-N-methylase [Lachnospiraceae bacterium]